MKTNPDVPEILRSLKPGDTVYTILRHVSRSGMQREVSLVIIRPDGSVRDLTYAATQAIGSRIGRHDGLVVGGCGFDAGFEVVYNLGRVLWPDGHECAGESCPSNDHSNGDRDYTPHHHGSGGYALRHKWL